MMARRLPYRSTYVIIANGLDLPLNLSLDDSHKTQDAYSCMATPITALQRLSMTRLRQKGQRRAPGVSCILVAVSIVQRKMQGSLVAVYQMQSDVPSKTGKSKYGGFGGGGLVVRLWQWSFVYGTTDTDCIGSFLP